MQAKLVDIAELKKTPEQREVERLIAQLTPDKAIEVTLNSSNSVRRLSRLFRQASKAANKEIRTRRKGDRLYISLRKTIDFDVVVPGTEGHVA